jgi:hypothetical protein
MLRIDVYDCGLQKDFHSFFCAKALNRTFLGGKKFLSVAYHSIHKSVVVVRVVMKKGEAFYFCS